MKKLNQYLLVFTCTMTLFMTLSLAMMNQRLEKLELRTDTKELLKGQQQALEEITAEFDALNKKIDKLPK